MLQNSKCNIATAKLNVLPAPVGTDEETALVGRTTALVVIELLAELHTVQVPINNYIY